jgi:hypothetical protein
VNGISRPLGRRPRLMASGWLRTWVCGRSNPGIGANKPEVFGEPEPYILCFQKRAWGVEDFLFRVLAAYCGAVAFCPGNGTVSMVAKPERVAKSSARMVFRQTR